MDKSGSGRLALLRCIVFPFTTFGSGLRRTPALIAVACVLWGASTRAQEPQGEAPAKAEGEEEIIVDPELAGTKPVETSEAAMPASQPWSDLRVVLRSRVGVDTRWERPREDVVEATEIAVLEAEHHRSDTVGFAVGLRARHAFGARGPDGPSEGAQRYELDVAPTAGYADLTITDGLHVRAGYQVITMGRFDVWSAVNFLPVYDLRSGPITMPEALHVAQPALRLDYDQVSWLTVSAYYVPFFQPHRANLYGTDYAMLERPLEAGLPSISMGPETQQQLEGELGRSGAIAGADGVASAFAPEPSGTKPQGALRVTLRGAKTEIAATAGTALERLPAALLPVTSGGVALQIPRLAYNRFYVLGLDGALGVGPVQLGAEASYVFDRTLPTISDDATAPPGVGQTDIVHLGLRAELVESEAWFVSGEGFVEFARDEPPDDPLDVQYRWYALDAGNRLEGAALALRWAPVDTGLTIEAAGVALNGPTFFVLPRIEYQLFEPLYVELGAAIVEGSTSISAVSPNAPIGSIFDDVDQVFVGVKLLP